MWSLSQKWEKCEKAVREHLEQLPYCNFCEIFRMIDTLADLTFS